MFCPSPRFKNLNFLFQLNQLMMFYMKAPKEKKSVVLYPINYLTSSFLDWNLDVVLSACGANPNSPKSSESIKSSGF